MTYNEVIKELKTIAKPSAIEKKKRFGLYPKDAIGVMMSDLNIIAKRIKRDDELALQLFESEIYEARLLVSKIFTPKNLTNELMEKWVKTFNNWEIVDSFCMKLFVKSPFAVEKIKTWTLREEEFVKRSGFVIMASYGLGSRKDDNPIYESFQPILLREAHDNRIYVKKAISWALRTIGKRNIDLHKVAIKTAKEMLKINKPAAQWIAKDVLKELEGEKLTILGYPRTKYQRVKWNKA